MSRFFKPFTRSLTSITMLTWIGYQCVSHNTLCESLKLDEIDHYIESQYLIQQFPGCSVTVIKSGDIVYSKGFGYGDIENRVKMHGNSVMRIASISKSITSVVISQLIENGQLDIHQSIQYYLKDFPMLGVKDDDEDKQHSFTVLDALTHRSGIRHYKDREVYSTKHYLDSISTLEIFKNDSLLFVPGTQYSYSVRNIFI